MPKIVFTRWPHPAKPGFYYCGNYRTKAEEFCRRSFTNADSLETHTQSKHNGWRCIFGCSLAEGGGTYFQSRVQLWVHVKTAHNSSLQLCAKRLNFSREADEVQVPSSHGRPAEESSNSVSSSAARTATESHSDDLESTSVLQTEAKEDVEMQQPTCTESHSDDLKSTSVPQTEAKEDVEMQQPTCSVAADIEEAALEPDDFKLTPHCDGGDLEAEKVAALHDESISVSPTDLEAKKTLRCNRPIAVSPPAFKRHRRSLEWYLLCPPLLPPHLPPHLPPRLPPHLLVQ